jgi:serine/threonine protein kinase
MSVSQGESEFWAEVSTLGRLAHPNLVKLVGYCSHRGERLVAYEYMPKGSLKDYLHGESLDL